jgi:hypothetical protein
MEFQWRRTLVLYNYTENTIYYKCTAENNNAVQVSDTTMLNIVENAGYKKNILANNKQKQVAHLTASQILSSSVGQN